jgi:hypothetical protein
MERSASEPTSSPSPQSPDGHFFHSLSWIRFILPVLLATLDQPFGESMKDRDTRLRILGCRSTKTSSVSVNTRPSPATPQKDNTEFRLAIELGLHGRETLSDLVPRGD